MTKPFRRGALSRIGIAVGDAVPAAAATPEHLHSRVAHLRGDWK
jgi:hypothetical protein